MTSSTMAPLSKAFAPRHEQRPFRVCILGGMIHAHDAIGACILTSLDAIQTAIKGQGPRIEIRLYCLSSSIDDPRLHRISDWRDVLADDFYVEADLIIHHFGIFSEIHNAISFARRSAHLVVAYHGLTPPQYLAPSAQDVMQKSFRQLGLLNQVDEIIVTSQTIGLQLQRCGINRPVRQIELFAPNGVPHESQSDRPRNSSDVFKIIYCGRFVESKGVLELVEALKALEIGARKISLTLAGLKKLSDEGYLAAIRQAMSRLPAHIQAAFCFDQSQDELSSLIFESDLLVLPSRHEGFGIPVVEALMSGTPVLCSDAGALPEVAGGLAKTFQSGNWETLTLALSECLKASSQGMVATDAGRIPLEAWRETTSHATRRFTPAAYQERWAAYIRERVDGPRDHSDTLVASSDAYQSISLAPDIAPQNVLDQCILNAVQTAMGKSPTTTVETRPRVAGVAADRLALSRHLLSIEAEEAFIQTAHQDILGRNADTSIIESWLRDFKNGAPRQELLDTLFTSRDYVANFAGREVRDLLIEQCLRSLMRETCSDEAFVRRAFRIALQRPVDEQALKGYHRALTRGKLDRTRLLVSVFLSEEFANRTSAALGSDLARQFKAEFKSHKLLTRLKRIQRIWGRHKRPK